MNDLYNLILHVLLLNKKIKSLYIYVLYLMEF